MSVHHFEVVSFEPWKDGVVRIRIAADEPEGRVCHTFYARQEDYDDRVKERDTHAAEVARLRGALEKIANAYADAGPPTNGDPYEDGLSAGYLKMGEIARTALAPAARKETT